MDQDLNTKHRAFLAEKRENLRGLYARYMKYGSQMRAAGLVTWSKERPRGWYAQFLSDRPLYDRETIKMLMNLQRDISEQAMLLLELEHSLDCEEAALPEQCTPFDE